MSHSHSPMGRRYPYRRKPQSHTKCSLPSSTQPMHRVHRQEPSSPYLPYDGRSMSRDVYQTHNNNSTSTPLMPPQSHLLLLPNLLLYLDRYPVCFLILWIEPPPLFLQSLHMYVRLLLVPDQSVSVLLRLLLLSLSNILLRLNCSTKHSPIDNHSRSLLLH